MVFKRRKKMKESFKKKVLKAIRYNKPEMKEYQAQSGVLYPNSAPSSNANVLGIPYIAQALGKAGRAGNSIKLQKLDYRIRLAASEDALAYAQQSIRILLVHDKDPVGGTLPDSDTVLQTLNMESHKSITNRDRYTIVHDRISRFLKVVHQTIVSSI